VTPPPLIKADQHEKDTEHIKLLSVFHFLISGLAIVEIGFLVLHHFMMDQLFSNPDLWKSGRNDALPPKEFFEIFKWFYVFMGVALIVGATLNLVSGLFLRQRKHRMFCLVVAGLNCFQFPFGTALGVFTIMVLIRDSVRRTYASC